MENGHHRRTPWFHCPCCPPNISRLIASIGEYAYSQAGDRVYVQMYHENSVTLDVGGNDLRLVQETQYPWDGNIRINVNTVRPAEFELALRIPDWCYDYQLAVNGAEADGLNRAGLRAFCRENGQMATQVELTLAMPVERVMPHPSIRQTAGQIALQRGPLVYCLEEVDNGSRLANVCIPANAALGAAFDSELLGGASVISAARRFALSRRKKATALYRHHSQTGYNETAFTFKAIPYYMWANRDLGEMRVWIRSS